MSEWWTYRPSDFLMFSARTYGRMVESYNRDMWPLQLVMIAAGIVVTGWVFRGPAPARRMPVMLILLALAWLWVAWAFHWTRFAQINTAAPYFAAAFATQAALLVVLMLLMLLMLLGRAGEPAGPARASTRPAGAALCGFAVVIYPLLAPLMGRGWAQAEVFGLMPEPTALATLGVLLASGQRYRAVAAAIPVLSLLIGGTTAWLLWMT